MEIQWKNTKFQEVNFFLDWMELSNLLQNTLPKLEVVLENTACDTKPRQGWCASLKEPSPGLQVGASSASNRRGLR
jgi:hypothetical protein